jgi:hypothetical protein
MTTGPGRIERAIETLFDAERDNAFTVEELCERIYGVVRVPREQSYNRDVGDYTPNRPHLESKHRHAVVRAARNIGKRRPEIQHWVSETLTGTLVFFRHDEVLSYAMGRLKADFLYDYRNKDPRQRRVSDETALRKKLADERHQRLIAPGGAWRRFVQMFLAERDGDADRLAELEAEARRQDLAPEAVGAGAAG